MLISKGSSGTPAFRISTRFPLLTPAAQESPFPVEFSTTIMLGNKAVFPLKELGIVFALRTWILEGDGCTCCKVEGEETCLHLLFTWRCLTSIIPKCWEVGSVLLVMFVI